MRAVALLSLLAVAFTQAHLEILDSGSFDAAIAEGTWFVKFYAPWCGHCKRLAPTWDTLADEVAAGPLGKEKGIHIAKVDCTTSKAVCDANGVRGYPSLLLFKDGNKEGARYSGSRELDGLKSYLESA